MPSLSFLQLSVMLLPLVLVALIYRRWGGRPWEIPLATLRMVLQLSIMGLALNHMFDRESAGLTSVMLMVMCGVSAWIAMRHMVITDNTERLAVVMSILAGAGLNLLLIMLVVLKPEPWFNMKVVIPIAGMIFSSAMNAISLGAERFEREFSLSHDLETSRNLAFKASLIPQINSLMAVGLVSLPGMMTGQILAGVSPLIAVRYQMMVMAMILGTAGCSLAMYLELKRVLISKRS